MTTQAEKQAEPERFMPPHPRGIVDMFRKRGHAVVVRVDRNGSHRYSVDGARETDALTMTKRYERIYFDAGLTKGDHQ
jgi:hypothetical protein